MSGASHERIIDALDIIDPHFLQTPTFELPVLRRTFNVDVTFKDERVGPIGSFKGRGAEVLAHALGPGTNFVCASAGNFGQGMAWAARRRGSHLRVFAASGAVRCKVEAMERLGADVVLGGEDFDAAKDRARQFATESGAVFVEDGAHPEIAEGAGTIALELTAHHRSIDAIFVPLGNGALAAGIGGWIKHKSPSTRVIAVAAAGAPAMGLAVLGRPFDPTRPPRTIADGIAVRVPVLQAVAAVQAVVDEVIFVEDQGLRAAMQIIEDGTGRVVEPAGAAGLAGLLSTADRYAEGHVAVPICGGNRENGTQIP